MTRTWTSRRLVLGALFAAVLATGCDGMVVAEASYDSYDLPRDDDGRLTFYGHVSHPNQTVRLKVGERATGPWRTVATTRSVTEATYLDQQTGYQWTVHYELDDLTDEVAAKATKLWLQFTTVVSGTEKTLATLQRGGRACFMNQRLRGEPVLRAAMGCAVTDSPTIEVRLPEPEPTCGRKVPPYPPNCDTRAVRGLVAAPEGSALDEADVPTFGEGFGLGTAP